MAEHARHNDVDDPKSGFGRCGFLAPVRLLTRAQCRLTMDMLRSGAMARPPVWEKSLAVSERLVFDIGTRPVLVRLLRHILGEDIILWGAMFVRRVPGASHRWHCDVESAAVQGGFVSVWIGIENTCGSSALKLMKGSHRFETRIQEELQNHGLGVGKVDDAQVLSWARERHPGSEIVQPEMSDGDAIVFDGRLWHGSNNTLPDRTRTALLLQYARSNESVFMPDHTQSVWPVPRIPEPRPPVLTVSGRADEKANLIVRPPSPGSEERMRVFARQLDLPLERDLDKGWKPHFLFRRLTTTLQQLACHVSVLEPGHCPHLPHSHIEEELLVVMDGEAEIIIATSAEDPEPRKEHLDAGDFVYHPAFQHHTIRNTSDNPVSYLMLRWRSAPLEIEEPLGSTLVRLADFPTRPNPQTFDARLLFEQSTAFLSKLHSHATDLQPGAGYEPHADDYDVAIVLIEGEITTVGKSLRAPAVAFYASDEPHGIRNLGPAPARYVVFEFHGEKIAEGTETLVSRVAALGQEREALKARLRRLKVSLESIQLALEGTTVAARSVLPRAFVRRE